MLGVNDDQPYRADRNENPFPPIHAVTEAAGEAIRSINRYPDNTHTQLIAMISQRFGVPTQHVMVGAGATTIISQIVEFAAADGGGVVFCSPAAPRYAALATAVRAHQHRVPLAGWNQDLDAMAAEIDEATGVVVLGHPHDPTGTIADDSAIREFLAAVPPKVLVVFDEEYAEFVRDPAAPSGLDYYAERPNVLVVRTFSKAYGLAGLRIGFAVSNPPLIANIRELAPPYGVSTIAERAAIAALGAHDQVLARVDRLIRERDRLTAALRKQGQAITNSQGNFIWLPMTSARIADFSRACREHGIAVSTWENGVRITVGEPELNDALIYIAARFAQ